MSDRPPPAGPDDTQAHGSFEELITPKLEPGKACLIVIRGRSVGRMLELPSRGEATIGRAIEADLSIDDVAVSRQHARVRASREGFEVSDLASTNGVFVNGVRTERHTLHDGDRIQIGTTTILKFCYQDELEADYQRQLYDSATRDQLTRTYNRKFFLENLDVDFAHALKNGATLSLLLLDLDYFKSINDRFGHLAGDDVLRETASKIQKSLRPEDLLARYGGEEFAVLLRFTDPQFAWGVAERIRRAIEAHLYNYGGREFAVTVSVGMTTLMGANHASPRAFLEAADAALYEAKEEGRNRTVSRIPESSPPPRRLRPGDPDATVSGRRTPIIRPPAPERESPPSAETAPIEHVAERPEDLPGSDPHGEE